MLKLRKKGFFTMCVFLVSLSFGCASLINGNYGSITPDRNVARDFETYQVNPDFNYYISGSDVFPHAIIGIDKNYTLDSTLWKKVEFTPQKLKVLVQDMQFRVSGINQSLHGFAILDTKGNSIGSWYSMLTARTTVRIENHSVVIVTPDIDTYDRFEYERDETK